MPDADNFLHPTEKEAYQICPARHHYQYVEKIEPPYQSWYKVRGTIIHRTFAEGIERFGTIWNEELSEVVNRSQEDIDKERPKVEEICQQYFLFLREHNIERQGVEVPLEYHLCGVPHRCTLDALVTMPDTPPGMLDIIDFKSGAKWSYPAMNRKIQFVDYVLAARQNKFNIHRIFWGHCNDLLLWKRDGKKARRGERRGPFLYPLAVMETDAELEDLARTLSSGIIRAIHRGEWYYNNQSRVDCRMCEYQAQCPAFKSGIEYDALENLQESDASLEEQLRQSIEIERKKHGSEGSGNHKNEIA
jgi:hypothetical protein